MEKVNALAPGPILEIALFLDIDFPIAVDFFELRIAIQLPFIILCIDFGYIAIDFYTSIFEF